jgi:hypothetical protein
MNRCFADWFWFLRRLKEMPTAEDRRSAGVRVSGIIAHFWDGKNQDQFQIVSSNTIESLSRMPTVQVKIPIKAKEICPTEVMQGEVLHRPNCRTNAGLCGPV